MTGSPKSNRRVPMSGMLVMSLAAGSGTTAQAQFSGLGGLLGVAWLGSAVVGLIAIASTAWLLRPRVLDRRSLIVVALAYVVDSILSLAMVAPFRDGISHPLDVWPYAAGSLATFIAGILVGASAPRAPVLHSAALVSLDLLLTAASGIMRPLPLTIALMSRVVVGFLAAGCGALIGDYARELAASTRRPAGKFLAVLLVATIPGVLATVIAEIVLKHYGWK